MHIRATAMLVAAISLAASLASCSADPAAVQASITQQRRDQIKRVVSLRLTFSDPVPVAITDVRLGSPGFAGQEQVPWKHRPVLVQRGVAVALPVSLAPARCSTTSPPGPSSAVITVTDVKGQTRTIELDDLPDSGLLERIHELDCAVESLEERATFTLGETWTPTSQGGRRVWTGFIDIARSPPFDPPIAITDALGSVLVNFTPLASLPWRLPDQTQSRFPIEAGSSGRCDGHSMGESSKPFIFTLWVRSREVNVPVTLAVPKQSLGRWWELLSAACAVVR